jgi:cytochrome b6-f complex iron-sulfur subunit
MDRKDFLSLIGFGAAALVCGQCFSACQSRNNVPPPPENVDFTLDLTDPANSDLITRGGFIYTDRILVAHTITDEYVAVSQTCTHQAVTVQFDAKDTWFHCPNHGSNFTINGSVINGPATKALRKYNAVLKGRFLHIFS